MANARHVRVLREDVVAWNVWRRERPGERPDLSGVKLAQVSLSGANLQAADLSGADLRLATLRGVDLRRADLQRANLQAADLYQADLRLANLTESDLREASLVGANLGRTILARANLNNASLQSADLREAHFHGATLQGTDLYGADLSAADLRKGDLSGARLVASNFSRAVALEANFQNADLMSTLFAETQLAGANLAEALLVDTRFFNCDLSGVNGLALCRHEGPSAVDNWTLLRSADLPGAFLRGCGLPDACIAHLPVLRQEAVRPYSCFLSYAKLDGGLADRLHTNLQQRGVRCWLADTHLNAGGREWSLMSSTRLRDKVIVVISQESLETDWLEEEVKRALTEERKRDARLLVPIRLDGAVLKLNEPWARDLIASQRVEDFSNWEDPAVFEAAVTRLLRLLQDNRAS